MANMNFGVNILPKANNTYTLGNSDYKWNIFANTINGTSVSTLLSNMITDIQINGTSIISNGIANIPYASNNNFGVVKLSGSIYSDGENKLRVENASDVNIKAGASTTSYLVPLRQHVSVFYGLAKAAGDSTQSASSNAVGIYTEDAKAAIQNMLSVAPVNNPVFTGSISLGRRADTTIGVNSVAVGYDVQAIGNYSHAEGQLTRAMGRNAHAEGGDTWAYGVHSHTEGRGTYTSGYGTHAEGLYTEADGLYSHAEGIFTHAEGMAQHTFGRNNSTIYGIVQRWVASTSYEVGDIVYTYNNNQYFKCITANSDATFDEDKWTDEVYTPYVEVVGNGAYDYATDTLGTPSNARALEWTGNERLKGDLYVRCNADSSGGTRVATTTEVAAVDNQVIISSTQPTETTNKLWISNDSGTEVTVPTYSEFTALANAAVTDIKINNTSITTSGIANIPIASNQEYGVVKTNWSGGITLTSNNELVIVRASESDAKTASSAYKVCVPYWQHLYTFYGLAKAAGDATQAQSSNAAGIYTDDAKIAIQKMLGIYEPPYELVNDFTLDEETNFTLTASSNGTPYNFRNVYIIVTYPANTANASSGYGRYWFYDSLTSNIYVCAETSKYTTSTYNCFKHIFVKRESNLTIVQYTTRANTGDHGGWYSKTYGSGGGILADLGNIVKIAMPNGDVEPIGTRIRVYAQWAYQ